MILIESGGLGVDIPHRGMLQFAHVEKGDEPSG